MLLVGGKNRKILGVAWDLKFGPLRIASEDQEIKNIDDQFL
jgi:hypothetical protein